MATTSLAGVASAPTLGPDDTFVDLLRSRSAAHPDRRALTFLEDGEHESGHLTYEQLDTLARRFAAAFRARSRPGGMRSVLIFLPSGLDYVAAFFGALYAGFVPVTAYPPRPRRGRRTHGSDRLERILTDSACGALAVTTREVRDDLPALLSRDTIRSAEWLGVDECQWPPVEPASVARPEPADLALLQYTSGSTSTPRGVMISHRNLIHNEGVIRAAIRTSERSVLVSWLPLHHDMGLISMVLHALYLGASCVLLPPAAFIAAPRRWLDAITKHRGTHTGAPNFAFDLCVRRIRDEDLRLLDLRSLEVAFNGAEPVRARTVEAFVSRFAATGLREEAVEGAYGLAEATLCVSTPADARRPTIRSFDSDALERGHARPLSGSGRARRLVGCGTTLLPDQTILIVDPSSRRACPEAVVGEVWVGGISVACGYWQRPEETADVFRAHLEDGRGPFLRTGDLGFYFQDELFLAGRLKDVVIVGGRNIHPVDVEATVQGCHPAFTSHACVVFSYELDDEERIVVLQEVRRSRVAAEIDEVFPAIRRALWDDHRVQPVSILLVKPGEVPVTSSGKVQRALCRRAFVAGDVATLARWDDARPGGA